MNRRSFLAALTAPIVAPIIPVPTKTPLQIIWGPWDMGAPHLGAERYAAALNDAAKRTTISIGMIEGSSHDHARQIARMVADRIDLDEVRKRLANPRKTLSVAELRKSLGVT